MFRNYLKLCSSYIFLLASQFPNLGHPKLDFGQPRNVIWLAKKCYLASQGIYQKIKDEKASLK
jgi:hypothetical protein